MKRFLTRDQILEKAIELVREKGFQHFSMRELAKKLEIKAPSLYNHFSGQEELNLHIALKVSDMLTQKLWNAIYQKQRDEALLALGKAYREIAMLEPELYRVLVLLPSLNDSRLDQAANDTVDPFMEALSAYRLQQEDKIHLQRMYRSLLHGFTGLSQAGYLAHRTISTEESYQKAISYFILLVHRMEEQTDVQKK